MRKVVKEIPGYELHDAKAAPGWHHEVTGWRSDAVRFGPFIFVAAIGARPGTHELGETVEEQVRLIFQHFDTALQVHDAGLEDILHMTMYFTDRKSQWPVLDRVRREVFPKDPPVTVGVGTTMLASGAALEISAIAGARSET